MRRFIVHCGLLASLALPLGSAPGQPYFTQEEPIDDCGVAALYTLMNLQGFNTSVSDILSKVDGGSSRPHSLFELNSAAKALGCSLIGVKLDLESEPLQKTSLVFLERGPHGHFVTVRPVGQSGSLVQVFDSDSPPQVIDRSLLCASPEWTGFALTPSNSNNIYWTFGGFFLGLAFILAIRQKLNFFTRND